MNSLQELNNYSATTVTFTDSRGQTIRYDRITPTNFTLTLNEGQPHNALVGINIIDITNPDLFSVKPSLTISCTNTSAVVDWPVVPSGCNVTNPSPGVYKIDNITTPEIWDIVKSPIISSPNVYVGTWSYSASITSNPGATKQWTVGLTFLDVNALSVPTNMDYTENEFKLITGFPTIIDEGSQLPTWTLEIVPSNPEYISNITSFGAGGTKSFNSTTKKYTIVGIKTEVNSHLNSLYITFNNAPQTNMTLSYSAINYLNYESDTKVQTLELTSIRYLGAYSRELTFSEDIPLINENFPYPQVIDAAFAGTDTYSLVIDLSPGENFASLNEMVSSGIFGGTSTWNNSTKTLTITGTRIQVNSHLQKITFRPGIDWQAPVVLRYRLTARSTLLQTKIQTIACISTHAEISPNITNTRFYQYNTETLLWDTDTPQITDLNPYNPTYTITLNVTGGRVRYSQEALTSNFSYSESKANVNALLPQIKFTPDTNRTANGNITYTQFRNGVQQFQTTFIVDGPDYLSDAANPTNQTISIAEGATHTVPVGFNVTALNSTPTVSPRTYTINVSSLPGAIVTWTSIPSGCTVTNPSTGVYTISGFTTLTQWNTIKSPTVSIPPDFNGTFIYTASLPADGGTKTWNVTATVSEVSPLTVPTNYSYYPGIDSVITGVPQLVDTGNVTPSWTVTITPSNITSIDTFTNSATGGTFTVNATTKVITITGTLAQINARLSAITLVSISYTNYRFNLVYYASNTTNSETGTQTQILDSNDVSILTSVRADETYSTNTVTNISNGPQLADNGLGSYTVTVTPSPLAAVSLLTSVPGANYSAESIINTSLSLPTERDYGISGDGLTAFVGDPTFNSSTGRVLVYKKTGITWALEGTISPSDAVPNERVGGSNDLNFNSTVISNDGNTIAIAMGKKGTMTTGSTTFSAGRVYVFTRSGTTPTWAQTAVIDPDRSTYPGTSSYNFGYYGISISPNGNTLAIVANGFQVWIYQLTSGSWNVQGTILSGNDFRGGGGIMSPANIGNPRFSNGNNNVLAFSCTTSTASNNRFETIVVYTRSGTTWTSSPTFIDVATPVTTYSEAISYNTSSALQLGRSNSPYSKQGDNALLSISSDGSTVAAVQQNPSPSVKVFTKSGTTWTLQTTITGVSTNAKCFLSSDGDTLLIADTTGGAWGTVNGVDYWPTGFVKKYTRSGSTWTFQIQGNLESSTYARHAALVKFDNSLTSPMVGGVVYGFPTITYNAGSKVLTLTGSRNAINGQLDQIVLTPTTGYAQDFELIYVGTIPNSISASRNQRVVKI